MTGKILKKSLRVIAILIISIVLFLLMVMLYFNSKPGQKKLSNLLFSKLSEQIGTPVSGNLSFSIPDWIKLENLLIKDQKADTLLYAKKANLDVSLFKLLDNQVVIEQVELENTVAKIDKASGVFNFDYVIEAFSSTAPKDTSASSFQIFLDDINVKNLRVSYADKDLEQKFNVNLNSLTSGFKIFDLDKGIYDLKDSKISGLAVTGNLGKPSSDSTASSGTLPDIRLKNFIAENLNWNIDLGQQTTSGQNASLDLSLKSIHLPKMALELSNLNAAFTKITFKDKNAGVPKPGEMNFGDLLINDLTLAAENFVLNDTLIIGELTQLKLKEKSGFEITKTNTKFILKGDDLQLNTLSIATKNSHINSNIGVKLNPSDYAKSKFDAKISDLKLAASEALFFAPDLSKNPTFVKIRKDVFAGKGHVYGTAENLLFDNVFLSAPNSTRLTINGSITNQKSLSFDINVRDLYTTEKDLNKFAGPLPENIQIPASLTLNGSLKGTIEDISASLFLNSGQGGGRLAATLKNLSKTPLYAGTLTIENYAAGTLIKNPEVGNITGVLSFDGRSFENPAVNFKGDISEISYSGAKYQNIFLQGDFTNKVITTTGSIDDTKAALTLDALVDMTGEVVNITGNTKVKRVNLKALGLTKENISIAGNFDIKKLLVDLKKPFVDFKGTQITVYKDSSTYAIGDLTVLTEYGEKEKRLDLVTDFMNLSLSGNFEYDKLQNIMMGEVNKYFKIPDYIPLTDSLDFYFDVKGTINYNPVFTAFVPSLKNFKPITIVSGLKSDGDIPFSGNINIPFLQYDSIQVVSTAFVFTGDGSELKYDLSTGQISNPGFRIRKAELGGKLHNNIASFDLSVKDSLDKDIHSLAGILESDGRKVRISFDEAGSMLFYEEWGGNPYGYIDYSPQGLLINNLVFSSGNQMLRVNSLTEEPNGPLSIFAKRLDLNFLSRAVLQDSTLVSGYLDIDGEVSNYIGDQLLAFTGNADIDELKVNQVALGDLHARAESDDMEQITLLASLKGQNNAFELSGAYFTKKEESLDFKLDISSLDVKAIEPFLEGIAYEAKGSLNGDIEIKGSPQKPEITGTAEFTALEFKLQETAALFKVDRQKLGIKDSKILLEDFKVQDANSQEMTLNGTVDLSQIPELRYDLNVNATNFLIANSERGQSELFYGTAYLGAKLNIKGSNDAFKLTGDISTKEGTNVTILMPDESTGADLNTVVTFVDFRNPDTKIGIKKQSTLSLANSVNINVAVDEKSTLNILMNPITGDMLTASGNANLNLGFDDLGDLFIIGRFDITKGAYEMTFQAIQKKFEITPVSKSYVAFTGDPTKGEMNITAEYKVPGRKDLMGYPGMREENSKGKTENSNESGSSGSTNEKDKEIKSMAAEIRIDLVLTGEVLDPGVDFQIVARREDLMRIGVDEANMTKLQDLGIQIINDRGEKIESSSSSGIQGSSKTASEKTSLNQNAIMLLIAGTFTTDQIIQSFASSSGAGYEDMARRNASQLINSQLEKYASGLIKGVDLNIGLQSSAANTVEGKTDRSTNLNFGVSKRLANDRLIVAVGKNFELENKDVKSDEIFDNAEVNWLITRDGRYRAKMFRKTQNQSAIEGSVIETGVGLIIGLEYNTIRELMTRKK